MFLRDSKHTYVTSARMRPSSSATFAGYHSRADIKPGTEAEKKWLKLNTEYTFWESARAAWGSVCSCLP